MKKVKVLIAKTKAGLEQNINEYIADKQVLDIKLQVHVLELTASYTALITYEELGNHDEIANDVQEMYEYTQANITNDDGSPIKVEELQDIFYQKVEHLAYHLNVALTD